MSNPIIEAIKHQQLALEYLHSVVEESTCGAWANGQRAHFEILKAKGCIEAIELAEEDARAFREQQKGAL